MLFNIKQTKNENLVKFKRETWVQTRACNAVFFTKTFAKQ